MKVRLQKVLAEAGLGSRRKCEEIISAKRVTVDDRVALLGESVDPEVCTVKVDGRVVTQEQKEYWLLNKPVGILSAVKDTRGRGTVTDLVPTAARIYPVGRLDLDSSGLLLLTNDGELAERLLHPRYHVDKEYVLTVRGELRREALDSLREGVELEEGVTSPAVVNVLAEATPANGRISTVSVVIHEGRKRQVRRMFAAVGTRVLSLHRARFACLADDRLGLGESRRLSEPEITALRRLARLH